MDVPRLIFSLGVWQAWSVSIYSEGYIISRRSIDDMINYDEDLCCCTAILDVLASADSSFFFFDLGDILCPDRRDDLKREGLHDLVS